jgi:hypothetical protein
VRERQLDGDLDGVVDVDDRKLTALETGCRGVRVAAEHDVAW